MYKRITERMGDVVLIEGRDLVAEYPATALKTAINTLANIEDLIDNKKAFVFRHKINDIVYFCDVLNNRILQGVVQEIRVDSSFDNYSYLLNVKYLGKVTTYNTLCFDTKEEAEKELKELRKVFI